MKCRSLTSDSGSRRPVGSPCESDDDCLYGQCTNKICTAPVLLCPTNIPGEYFSASPLLSVLLSLSLLLRLYSSSKSFLVCIVVPDSLQSPLSLHSNPHPTSLTHPLTYLPTYLPTFLPSFLPSFLHALIHQYRNNLFFEWSMQIL